MTNIQFHRLEGEALLAANRRFFLVVRRLADKYRKQKAADQELLNLVMELIVSQPQLSDWDPVVRSSYIELSSDVLGQELWDSLDAGPLPPEVITDGKMKADWLANLALSAIGSTSSSAKQSAFRYWTRSFAVDGLDELDVDKFLDAAFGVADSFGIEKSVASEIAQTEYVLLTSRSASTADLLDPRVTETARGFCEELICKEHLRNMLYESAIKLGVDIPKVAIATSEAALDSEVLGDGNEHPASSNLAPPQAVQRLWELPAIPTEADLSVKQDDLIFDLLAAQSALSTQTAERIDSLSRNPGTAPSGQFFFAARDIWQAFVRRGARDVLPLMERVAFHAFAQSVRGNETESRRRGALRLWTSALLPQKVLVWPVDELLSQMALLFKSEGLLAQTTDLEFREMIIEAFSGEARARETEGDSLGRTELIEENRIALRDVHRVYIERSDKQHRHSSDDTLTAWDYLFPPAAKQENIVSGPVHRIVDDKDFQTIIRRGGYEDTYQFATQNGEQIYALLERRLEISFGSDMLMMPTGKIFNPKGTSANQLNNQFIEARNQLLGSSPDYDRAAAMFERLADRLEGRPKDVANDYLAYALARNGVSIKARMKLSELSTNYTFSSAYWNRACCLPSEQITGQLEVLEEGLERAPHPQLLKGLVVLSARVSDTARLRKWLPCLTLTEALLIYYQLEYEDLDDKGKERQVLRLGANALEGEIDLLDPFDGSEKPVEIERMFDRLLKRDQKPAIDFWLRCRGLISNNRFDYWELRTNYLERTGAIADAARSFKEEVRCRLDALQRGIASKNKNISGSAQYLKRRVDKWLEQCQSPDLRPTGVLIYSAFVRFAADNEAVLRDLNIRLATYERFARYYGEVEEDRPRGTSVRAVGSSAPSSVARQGADLASGEGKLETILARVVGDAQARLHNVADLPLVRDQLDTLASEMERHGSSASSFELRRIVGAWSRYAREGSEVGRMDAWNDAQASYHECEKQFRHELRGPLWDFAQLLLKVLDRVTARLPQNSKLLPKLAVHTVDGGPATIDCESSQSAFAVIVKNNSQTATVRLAQAVASLDGDIISFPSRDEFDLVPVTVGPGDSTILTFSTPANFKIVEPKRANIALRYEFAGSEYDPGPFSVEISDKRAPSLPTQSPYIHSRMIEAGEIDGHFFGRDAEQEEILESVRNGQQRFRYVEGIRHSGKSSLLQSIEHEIEKRGLPLVPVYHPIGSARSMNSAGGILSNILSRVALHPKLIALELTVPDEQSCNENMPRAFGSFLTELSSKLPGERVLLMIDEMQTLAEAGQAAREERPALFQGIVGLLDVIRENGRPSSPLVWVFAGQVARGQFRRMMPGVLLWTELRSLPIDFLSVQAVEQIVRMPLAGYEIVVPDSTIQRVHAHTAGHPEVVQQVAELMLRRGAAEKRSLLTPADADSAARELAATSDDLFADTWYPAHLLSKEQSGLIADFVNSVRPGGRIELYKLAKSNEITEKLREAVDDLKAKKVLESFEDGTIGIKAYVLDLWLRRWVAKLVGTHQFGSPAIFLDIANLTGGKGTPYVANLNTAGGEGFRGRYTLSTVLDRIEKYVQTITPSMVSTRWAVNYPPGSPAVTEVSSKSYHIANIPEDLRAKGSDDVVLMEKIYEVETNYPTANHFVLILGDKDYRLNLERLVRSGKFVHIIAREESMASAYKGYATRYPEQVTAISLEELLDEPA